MKSHLCFISFVISIWLSVLGIYNLWAFSIFWLVLTILVAIVEIGMASPGQPPIHLSFGKEDKG